MFDTAVAGIMTIDEHGVVHRFNPACERLFGYTAAEIVGENVTRLMPTPHREGDASYVQRFMATGIRRMVGTGRRVGGRRRDGSTFPLHLSVGAWTREDGTQWFVGVLRDVTEETRAEQDLMDRQLVVEARNRELQQAQARTSRDLAAVGRLQRSLLPKKRTSVKGIRFDWLHQPCAQVGGDAFDFFPLDETHIGFYCIDVAGHGIPPALLALNLSQLLSLETPSESPLKPAVTKAPGYRLASPAEVMEQLNRRFSSDDEASLHFTMIYGLIDTRTGHVRLAQAGHPSPVLIRRNEVVPILGLGGFPLGLFDEDSFGCAEFDLEPGDRLFVYSDGVTECSNEFGEQFGETRLIESLTGPGSGVSLSEELDVLDKRLGEWRAGRDADDDVSVLALEVTEETFDPNTEEVDP